MEACLCIELEISVFPQHVRAGERRVAAEIDFDCRSEPTQIVAIALSNQAAISIRMRSRSPPVRRAMPCNRSLTCRLPLVGSDHCDGEPLSSRNMLPPLNCPSSKSRHAALRNPPVPLGLKLPCVPNWLPETTRTGVLPLVC